MQTFLCNMQRFLKAVKLIFLDEMIFFISAQNIDCRCTLDGSNEYT